MELTRESVSIVKVLAEEKGQTISIMEADDTEFLADRSFLRMAVVNLLDNAIKYSPERGLIRVNVRVLGAMQVEGQFVEIGIATRDQESLKRLVCAYSIASIGSTIPAIGRRAVLV